MCCVNESARPACIPWQRESHVNESCGLAEDSVETYSTYLESAGVFKMLHSNQRAVCRER